MKKDTRRKILKADKIQIKDRWGEFTFKNKDLTFKAQLKEVNIKANQFKFIALDYLCKILGLYKLMNFINKRLNK